MAAKKIVQKHEIQKQLAGILLSNLNALDSVSERISLSFDDVPDELVVAQYTKTVRAIADLTATIQALLKEIPEEVVQNNYTEMTDDQLLRILSSGV
jgi:hypothetical protein